MLECAKQDGSKVVTELTMKWFRMVSGILSRKSMRMWVSSSREEISGLLVLLVKKGRAKLRLL